MSTIAMFPGNASAFRRHFGVLPECFTEILGRVERFMAQSRLSARKVGRPRKLSTEQILAMTLRWHRESACLRTLAHEYQISISTAHRNISAMEAVLAEVIAVREEDEVPEVMCVTIDGTSTQIQRPKREQNKHYSGKKKRHELNTTVVTDLAIGQIIVVSQTVPGSIHDFAAYKQMKPFPESTLVLADSGYQGIAKLHPKSLIPHKKPKQGKLDAISSCCNRALALLRVSAEHIFCKIKAFKILEYRWRNRLARYNRTFRIIAGFVNMDMARPDAVKRWQENVSRRIQSAITLFHEADGLIATALGTI